MTNPAGRGASVVLVGPRAAGKSTLARALAQESGWFAVDTDALLAARVGRSAGAFLAAVGEAEFRRVEAAVACAALDAPVGDFADGTDRAAGNRVIALGGGAVLSARIRSRLARPQHFVVFLSAPVAVLADRYEAGPDRPPLTDLPRSEEIQRLLDDREPLYRSVCDLELDTFSANVHACVRTIVANMGRDAE